MMETNRRKFIKHITAVGGVSALGGKAVSAMWQSAELNDDSAADKGLVKIVNLPKGEHYKPLDKISIETGSKGKSLCLTAGVLNTGVCLWHSQLHSALAGPREHI